MSVKFIYGSVLLILIIEKERNFCTSLSTVDKWITLSVIADGDDGRI